jgi:hypothetical protein
VDIQILEGRLIEFPTPDATGVDRRAFGEFIGPEGELASYALGWTTGSQADHGYLSIGIGAGRPGGATIHAIAFDNRGQFALSLTDETFEDVPEGGPHLTAAQAREHEDLPFMQSVADHVFLRDRRAWWMRHWLQGTRCIQTSQVFDLSEPVLLVHNDDDDDLWQLIGTTGAADDGKIAHLSHAVAEDPTLMDVLDLAPGVSATRERRGGPWTREDHPSIG